MLKLKQKSAEVIKHEENVRRGKRSKRKGSSYERTIAEKFRDRYGLNLKRTPQSGGFAKSTSKARDFRGDIVLLEDDKDFLLHCECKNTQTWSLPAWLRQSEGDCPEGKVPLVIFHKHGTSQDYVCLSLENFFRLVNVEDIVESKRGV